MRTILQPVPSTLSSPLVPCLRVLSKLSGPRVITESWSNVPTWLAKWWLHPVCHSSLCPLLFALTAQKSRLCHNNDVIGALQEGFGGRWEGSGGALFPSHPHHSAGRWTTKSPDSFVGPNSKKKKKMSVLLA